MNLKKCIFKIINLSQLMLYNQLYENEILYYFREFYQNESFI